MQSKRGRIGGAIGGKISKGGGRPSLGEPWISLGISRRKFFMTNETSKWICKILSGMLEVNIIVALFNKSDSRLTSL